MVSIRDTNTVPSRVLCRQVSVEERFRPRGSEGQCLFSSLCLRWCTCNPREEEIKESSNKVPNRAGFLGAGAHPWGLSGQESACSAGEAGLIPGREDPLEKDMATHSSVLAWRIPWTEEPGGLQSTGSQSRTRLSDGTAAAACGWKAPLPGLHRVPPQRAQGLVRRKHSGTCLLA